MDTSTLANKAGYVIKNMPTSEKVLDIVKSMYNLNDIEKLQLNQAFGNKIFDALPEEAYEAIIPDKIVKQIEDLKTENQNLNTENQTLKNSIEELKVEKSFNDHINIIEDFCVKYKKDFGSFIWTLKKTDHPFKRDCEGHSMKSFATCFFNHYKANEYDAVNKIQGLREANKYVHNLFNEVGNDKEKIDELIKKINGKKE